ncbi:hypothetical protein [Undibacterium luofuense]|uniref:Lipoprotein n=1 Tax=Undibacterium luofuense TaxID=2828733 RepID=A0A941DM10_9BURK|nr:hypothetical protein [Undibacterium luofuense]MBR7783602.1 hypothetical protein [Undibacterium luofuense]
MMRIPKVLFMLSASCCALLLAACGGSSPSNNTVDVPNDPGIPVVVTPYKGAYTAGSVTAKDSSGKIIATGTINGSVANMNMPVNAVYPVTLYVSGTYRNEATGGPETSQAILRSVIPDSGSVKSGIAITPLTEIVAAVLDKRVSDGETMTAELVNSVTTMVASSVLNLSLSQAMAPPVFNVSNGKTSDVTTFKLAALALAANTDGAGATLADKVVNIANRIAKGEVPDKVLSHFADSLAAVTASSGVSSQQSDSTHPVTVPVVTLANYPLVDTQPVTQNTLRWDSTGIWGTAQWR